MKAAFFIAPLFALLSLSACEEPTPPAPPTPVETFVFQGKPIDPICFNGGMDQSADDPIDLTACTGTVGKDAYTVSEKGLETFDDGSVGYTFQCEGGCMTSPFIAYKLLGMVDGHYAVEVESSGGGTGQFTDVRLVDLKAGKLIMVEQIGGGDRCNGGLASASVKDGVLHHAQNVTPFDMIELTGGNKAGFEAYEDIQACAACCVGEANFEAGKIMSVTLTQAPEEIIHEDLGPKDACFFGTYNETYMAKKTPERILDLADLRKFGETFNERCAQLKGKRLPISTVPTD